MKNFLIGITLGLLIFYAIFKYKEPEETNKVDGTELVQEQLKNVSELIITEGRFSDIITYKDAKKFYLDWITSEKKAVVLVKAKATLSYNLRELEYFTDPKSNTIVLTHIPEVALNIYPSLEYYDIEQEYLNPFKAADYNKIDQEVRKRLYKQIENSNFKSNAENRLISELFFLLNKGDQQWKIIIENKENALEKLIE